MTRLLVATRKGLFTVDRSVAGKWSVANGAFLADHVSFVMADPRDGALFAGLAHGHFGAKLHRSRDGGQSWEECGTPRYPERPDGANTERDPFGREIPWKLAMIWALEPGGREQTGTVWCGTIPGGLFKSTDGGDTWELVRSLWEHPKRKEWFGGGYDYPGIHSVSVDPRNSAHALVAVSCGGVWKTENGGADWTLHGSGMWAEYMPPERRDDAAIQDPHCMVRCTARPDVLWIQHHNGVFRSVDGGRRWNEIEHVPPSNFGFPVAVHPNDPDTAWLVPATDDEQRIPVDGKVVVSRTTDGGKSFDVLTHGLPQKHAYDVVFRHALDVDRSGDVLAFGSTTGSLWVSENGGDSWITVTSHLPPVYCVRFDER